ncbi:MAG: adenine nucleotide alpha hydrolase [Pseudomonadota bacterium]
MLLATLAHRAGRLAVAVHAASPAVPAAATERVRRTAMREGWPVAIVDAGELADPQYAKNPANRCYFCKSNLYARMRRATDAQLASGANLDDLGDIRPGLLAASERNVVHPFIEAGVGKAEIGSIAGELGLTDLVALPPQPCLSSRIETGLTVTAERLRFIEEAEERLAKLLPPSATLRCRITAAGVAVEVAPLPEGSALTRLASTAEALCAAHGRTLHTLRPYRRGSAFLWHTLTEAL